MVNFIWLGVKKKNNICFECAAVNIVISVYGELLLKLYEIGIEMGYQSVIYITHVTSTVMEWRGKNNGV